MRPLQHSLHSCTVGAGRALGLGLRPNHSPLLAAGRRGNALEDVESHLHLPHARLIPSTPFPSTVLSRMPSKPSYLYVQMQNIK